MGGIVSAGRNNDDLIDKLVEAKCIRSALVEKVFRSVDRAFYFLPEFRRAAYRDQAWQQGNLHLSAPCIYSEVLEQLNLQPGQSFLNIGSGTGYLSTMVGLILGPNGINHGIEIHPDVVDYAYEKLEKFKSTCSGVDVFEFCEPHFIVGNAFDLYPDRKYDRIYCGAACHEEYYERIQQFMKIGGILVVPCVDELLRIKRIGSDVWEKTSVLEVTFSGLVRRKDKTSNSPLFLDSNPQCLQALCRAHIRSLLRDIAEKDDTELKNLCHRRANVGGANDDHCKRRRLGREVVNYYRPVSFQRFMRTFEVLRSLGGHNDEDDDDDNEISVNTSGETDADISEGSRSENSAVSTNDDEDEVNFRARDRVPKRQFASKNSIRDDQPRSTGRSESFTNSNWQRRRFLQTGGERRRLNRTVSCTLMTGNGEPLTAEQGCRHNVIEKDSSEIDMDKTAKSRETNERSDEQKRKNESSSNQEDECENQALGVVKEEADSKGGNPKKPLKRDRIGSDDGEDSNGRKHKTVPGSFPLLLLSSAMEIVDGVESQHVEHWCSSRVEDESDEGESKNDNEVARGTNEEDNENNSSSSSSSSDDDDDLDENEDEELEKNDTCDNTFESEEAKDSLPMKYRVVMEKKISVLPLPPPLKTYLNYNRPFIFSC